MELGPPLKGSLTFIPGVRALYRALSGPRHSRAKSAGYCYDIWLKHLVLLWQHGLHAIPETVAELGPGSSLGVGLAALLMGARRYYAFDVWKRSDIDRNLVVLDELVELLRTRRGHRPGGWPDVSAYLDSAGFPAQIFAADQLDHLLSGKRVEKIKRALVEPTSGDGEFTIRYFVPWHDLSVLREDSVDLIVSQSVLEHVNDLEHTYAALSRWLRPEGWMSHQVDLSSHKLTKRWNGHWAYSTALWKMVVGGKPFLINRQPASAHMNHLRMNGFSIVSELRRLDNDGLPRSKLAKMWRGLSQEDLICRGLFIQATKSA